MEKEIFAKDLRPGQEVILFSNEPLKSPSRKWLKSAGIFLITLSFFSFLFVFMPLILLELRLTSLPTVSPSQPIQRVSAFGNLLGTDIPAKPVWNFVLQIPEIGVDAEVFPNIDPTSKEEYLEVLKSGVAHAKGTSFPDKIGTTYIFGHSSTLPWDREQKPYFYLLKNLEVQDEIIVFFSGKRLTYQVADKVITGPNDIPDFVSQENERLLVLQTCWPPGTAWKRLYIIAEPASENLSHR